MKKRIEIGKVRRKGRIKKEVKLGEKNRNRTGNEIDMKKTTFQSQNASFTLLEGGERARAWMQREWRNYVYLLANTHGHAWAEYAFQTTKTALFSVSSKPTNEK